MKNFCAKALMAVSLLGLATSCHLDDPEVTTKPGTPDVPVVENPFKTNMLSTVRYDYSDYLTYTYNLDNELVSIEMHPENRNDTVWAFTRDTDGKISQITKRWNYNYRYDDCTETWSQLEFNSKNALTKATVTLNGSLSYEGYFGLYVLSEATYKFTYDSNNHLTKIEVTGIDHAVNGYDPVNGTAFTKQADYSWDANGDLTRATLLDGKSVIYRFTEDKNQFLQWDPTMPFVDCLQSTGLYGDAPAHYAKAIEVSDGGTIVSHNDYYYYVQGFMIQYMNNAGPYEYGNDVYQFNYVTKK